MGSNQTNGTEMEKFMNAMNGKELDIYLANKDKSKQELIDAMEDNLRVTVYNLFEEAMKEQKVSESKATISTPQATKVRFQPNGGSGNHQPGSYNFSPPMYQNHINYQNNYGNQPAGLYNPLNAPTNQNSAIRRSEQSLVSNGSSERDDQKSFMLTINAQVAPHLNANGFAITRLLREKFRVKMNARPHEKKLGCTFVQFFGPVSRDLAMAQDEMWLHLRSVQNSRTIMNNKPMCDMWRGWNAKNKNIFRNKTNSTVDTTEVDGELIIRAFNQTYLDNVQEILTEYVSMRLRPEDDKELAKKVLGF